MSFSLKYGKIRFYQFLIVFLCATSTGYSQVQSVFQYITPSDVSDLSLSLDLTELIAQKKTNNYLSAVLTTAKGEKIGAEVRPRGRYRRRICDVPPIKIKFKKKQLHSMGLDTLNEVRLALPCLDNEEAEANIVREYLAYKIYERLNPQYHVKARLVRLKLHDTQIDKTYKPVYALLIEHEEEISARLGGVIEENYNLPLEQLDEMQLANNALFQYLIGNTDWDIQMIRNVYPFKPQGADKFYIIPYDFDFSGFVSAPYAKVTADKGIKSVRERALMADGVSEKAMMYARKSLEGAKADILDLCTFKYLNAAHRNDCYRYVEFFFENMEAGKPLPKTMEDFR